MERIIGTVIAAFTAFLRRSPGRSHGVAPVPPQGTLGARSRAGADPEVVPRVVDVLAAGLLRARWRPLLVDVGPERVLGAEERPRGEVEDQVLVRGPSVGEAGRPRQWRQAD